MLLKEMSKFEKGFSAHTWGTIESEGIQIHSSCKWAGIWACDSMVLEFTSLDF